MMRHFYNAMLRVKSVLTTLLTSGKSLECDRTSNHYFITDDDIGDIIDFSADAFTVSGRFFISPQIFNGRLFAFRTTSTTYFECYINANGAIVFITRGGAGIVSIQTANDQEYKWLDITITRDASLNYTYYANGQKIGTGNGGYNASTSALQLAIMAWNNKGSVSIPCDGLCQRFAIWKQELTEEQAREVAIQTDLKQLSFLPNNWWNFEDDNISGTSVIDIMGNNDCTMANSPARINCISYPQLYQLETTSFWENTSPNFDGSTSTLVPYGGFAWDFDGVNDFITCGDADVFSFTDGAGNDEPFSLSGRFWVDSTGTGSQGWITKGSLTNTSIEYRLYISGDKITFILYDTTIGNIWIGRTGATLPSLGYEDQWIHVMATYDGSETTGGITIYVNGEQYDTTDTTSGSYTGMSNTSEPLRISSLNGSANYFNGKIAEVMVLDKECSQAEAQAVFNNHEPRDERKYALAGNIVGYWSAYKSATGAGNVTDLSGNGNHGTMTNMTDSDIVSDFPREAFDLANGNQGSFTFNGSTQYVSIPDAANLSFASGGTDVARSIGFYAKIDASAGYIFSKFGAGAEREYICNVGSSAMVFTIYDTAGTSNSISISSTISSYFGQWAYYLISYTGVGDETGLSIKVNGVDIGGTQSQAGTYTAAKESTADLEIGRRLTSYSDPTICHFSVISGVPSACEQVELYNDGSPVDVTQVTFTDDFDGHWRMDGSDSGSTATDSIGSNDGTYINSPTFSSTDYPTN